MGSPLVADEANELIAGHGRLGYGIQLDTLYVDVAVGAGRLRRASR